MAANVWKKSLKNVESDNNKILYENLLDFLQRNGTYFLNKPRIIYSRNTTVLYYQVLYNLSTTCFGHFTWPSSGCI